VKLDIKTIEEDIKKKSEILGVLKDAQLIREKSLEGMIYQKYIELQRTDRVAEYINELGYRIKTNSYIGERKYIHKDVTSVICEDVHKNNNWIQKIAYALYRYNFGSVKYGQTYKALLNGNKRS